MERASFFVIYIATLALFVNLAAAQTVHVVGDSLGWAIPPNTSLSYSNWASGKTFMVGDILEFNFVTNEHDLVQVPKASYDDCSDDDAISSVITTGPVNITLDSAGDRHYICTYGRHCESGQKLSITVVSSSTPGGAATPPPMTPPPATPTTPSPATPQPDACAPTPNAGGAPTAGPPPQSSGPPPPPLDSAAVSAASSFLLIIMSAGVVFFL